MTRKHFIALAALLKDTYIDEDTNPVNAVKDVAERMADYFKSENPNFDRKRFLDAAGFGE